MGILCNNYCLLTSEESKRVNVNTFVADSGASAHMVLTKILLTDLQEDIGIVTIGDSSEPKSEGACTFIGFHIKKEDGKEIEVSLKNCFICT
jgi:hypothetical protein